MNWLWGRSASATLVHGRQAAVAGVAERLLAWVVKRMVAHLVGDVGEPELLVRIGHRERPARAGATERAL